MTNATVSVILPTYERPDLLERAIGSVLQQTYRQWQLIVVDDNEPTSASKNDTASIVSRLATYGRIDYIQHEGNRGGAAARNTGIKRADGEVVAFLDDDDTWHPEKLQAQIKVLAAATDSVGLIYAGVEAIDVGTGTSHVLRPTKRGSLYPDILASNFVGTTSGFLCKRELLLQVGMFDESLAAAQDYDLCIRLAEVCEFDFVDRVFIKRYKHPGTRITHNLHEKIAAFQSIYEKHRATLEEHPHIHSSFLFNKGRFEMEAADRYAAARTFRRAWQLNPSRLGLLGHWLMASTGSTSYQAARLATRPFRRFARRLSKT